MADFFAAGLAAAPLASRKDQGFRQDLSVKLICPNCKDPHPNIVEAYSSGDLVCGDCGLVLGDRIIDTRSEWRTFANDEGGADPSRVGGPSNILLEGADQFDTVISFKDNNTGVSKDLQRAAAKMGGRQGTTSGSGERHLLTAFRAISDMCDTINLPRMIHDVAKQLYKRVDDEKILRGKGQNAIIAAVIFVACRQANVERSLKEIVQLTGVPKKQLAACFSTISQHFKLLAAGSTPAIVTTPGLVDVGGGAAAENLLPRFCSHLGLSQDVTRAAKAVAKAARTLGTLDGRSPLSVASACIFFATHLLGEPKPARVIAEEAGVSESTLRTSYRYLSTDRDKIVASSKFFTVDRAHLVDVSRLP